MMTQTVSGRRRAVMNQYGQMAQDYWSQWLPTTYQQIPDPTSYFSMLGQEIAQAVADLTP